MNTHSHSADARMEVLASNALRAGADGDTARAVLNCNTTDEALDVLHEKQLLQPTMEEIMKKITLWYDCEVVFTDQSLKDMRLSGNMRRYDSVEKILHYLEITTGAKFAVKGRTIFVGK